MTTRSSKQKESVKRPEGRPPFVPTDAQRKKVYKYASVGVPQEFIARLIINPETKSGIGLATLNKYFRDELDLASTKATADVGGALYKNAISGNVTAQIFWMKTRAGWKETDKLEVSGTDGAPLVSSTVSVEEYLKARKEILESY